MKWQGTFYSFGAENVILISITLQRVRTESPKESEDTGLETTVLATTIWFQKQMML